MSERSSGRRRLAAAVIAVAVLTVTPLAVTAADRFTDVPNSNVFHDNISWLADAGVTKGCNPPANTEFCPGDNVTREQMAAFMQRLAEAKVVDAATAETAGNADNAAMLGGVGPVGYQNVVQAAIGSFAHGTSLGSIGAGAPFEATSVNISVPQAGALVMTGSTGWEGGDVWFTQWIEINQATPCDNWNSTDRLPGSGTEESADSRGASLNSQAIVEAPQGNHTVSLCLWPFSSTANSLNVSVSLIAAYQPVSSGSIVPAGVGPAGDAPAGGPSSR